MLSRDSYEGAGWSFGRRSVATSAGEIPAEAAVAPSVNEFAAGRSAQGNAAEDEGPGIEAQVLPAELALLANEVDGFELLEATDADSY